MKNVKLSQKLTESGLMLALATILSLIKVVDLPYGGSITFASMLPPIIIAFRYGFGWGALTGFVYSLIQLITGLNSLSYATSAAAAVAIILLDYVIAFTAVALGGVFNKMKNAPAAFGYSALLVCAVRYVCHVISGCTVWAGLSIPTSDALLYSFIYNATYMIPETVITVVAAIYVGSVLDFRQAQLAPVKRDSAPAARAMSATSGFVVLAAVAAVVAMIFAHLQNPETGEFDITGIAQVNTTALIIVVCVAVVVVAALQLVKRSIVNKAR